MALQQAWLAQKRNDFQLPGECLQGGECGHPKLVKSNGSDGSFSPGDRLFLGRRRLGHPHESAEDPDR
jgi:hypothetical protein